MRRAMVVVLVVAAAAAAAMSIREHSRSLGKSGDHKSELFEDVSDGPEGGGSISYRLTGDEVQTFLISSDFSPGNGSRPQTVPEKLCRERLTALAALLKARGFQGLAVHPEVCAQKARVGAVSR